MLGRFDEAIPVFQHVRQDPKYRIQASTLLGRAFLQAGFVDEAVDTLNEAIQGYAVRGDEKSIEIHYYYANALESKGDIPAALKMYSQVAQWNFNYRDVQKRIKSLRGGGGSQAGQTPPAA
jgi:tetratricopeptide (TPR) repeat protein